MATKPQHPTEEARRRLQSGRGTLADAVQATLGPLKEGDVPRDKEFNANSIPKGGRTVRTMAPPPRQYWPSANSRRTPSRPQGSKKSSR